MFSLFSAKKTDETLDDAQKSSDAQHGQIFDAIMRAQAMIWFDLEGNILDANENFLNTLGYRHEEVVGQHHRIFVEAQYGGSPEYRKFWDDLRAGSSKAGEYCRYDKSGNEVWIQASYNPIYDDNGEICQFVKFAIDITEQKKIIGDAQGKMAGIDRTQAVIEFTPKGEILAANENFCAAVGYSLAEIVGKHHKIFVEKEYGASSEYAQFWPNLAAGQSHTGEFMRVRKDGSTIWIQATYTPITDTLGRVIKIVKFASDITAAKERAADSAGQLAAIGTSQAVIEFDLDGTILKANDNFLQGLGYSLEEIVGQHHKMFVDHKEANSAAYQNFWQDLAKGNFQGGEFRRIRKDGKEIWIQATYNPIMGSDGKPAKVVKFATDITQAKLTAADNNGQLSAISKSQAVIEFKLDGTITTANDNFLNALGYSEGEIKGQHHRIFVDDKESLSSEYSEFWHNLRNGTFQGGEFRRIRKDGSEIWIQATYNPIMDPDGKPYKVVKYASDITPQKHAVAAFAECVRRLEDGDLTAKIEDNLEGEFGELADAFNHSVQILNELVLGIQSMSARLASSANDISSASASVSTGAVQQAASLEESSAAMEELSITIKSNSDNTVRALQDVKMASKKSNDGKQISKDAQEAMSRIEETSTKVTEIIKLIETIAFQTNLLALNAAVEAARAGDSGKGFAVVAAEVRNLAKQSADAASEITNLVSESVESVSAGVDLVQQTSSALDEIGDVVVNAENKIENIATASEEQAGGVGELSSALAEIDGLTQSNAQSAENSSRGAHQLSEQASELISMANSFKTDNSSTGQGMTLRRAS